MAGEVHLIDGTYELFRHYFAMPSARDRDGQEVAGVIGVLGSLLSMVEEGATHLGVATDHVIESFRNDLWPGYKTGDGIDPDLLAQFHPLEDAMESMGVTVWRMTDLEADDGLASAARAAAEDPSVDRVVICTPDKDLAQCVRGTRVVQLDRRKRHVRDAAGVEARFGVRPTSIPDYLALVGDAADGFPGVRGWGAKSTATVLSHYHHLERIPADAASWAVSVRGSQRLAAALRSAYDDALLFRRLATLVDDRELFPSVETLRWRGPRSDFPTLCGRLGALGLEERARRAARLPSG